MGDNIYFSSSITFIHDTKVFNEIQNDKKILIFDLRKKDEYEINHLENSINIPYNEYELTFFSAVNEKLLSQLADNKEMKNNILRLRRFYIVILISQTKISKKTIIRRKSNCWEESDIISKSLVFYSNLQKAKVREMGLYNHGFEKINKHYFFLTKSLSTNPLRYYFLI
jgi:hypothetical protein